MQTGNVRHFESEEILGKTSALCMSTPFLNLVFIVVLISSTSFATEQPFLQIYCHLFISDKVVVCYSL